MKVKKISKILLFTLILSLILNTICSVNVKAEESNTLYDTIAKNAQLDTSVNFKEVPTDANVYTLSSTKDDKYPIYYYRGSVLNNNVFFANSCWQIVRTTENGGVKLIYTGERGPRGYCGTFIGDSAGIGKSKYSDNYNDNTYIGYMYNTAGASTYDATHSNINDSTIKAYIDEWYKNTMTSYTAYLEDAVWCNDRSIESGTGIGIVDTHYGATKRIPTSNNLLPSLSCSNENDRFTVNSSNGNGKLTYPVGLLTADEAVYAGYTYYNGVSSYLNKQDSWWTMTPFAKNLVYLSKTSGLENNGIPTEYSVRPSIVLKKGILINSGTGTQGNPYMITNNFATSTDDDIKKSEDPTTGSNSANDSESKKDTGTVDNSNTGAFANIIGLLGLTIYGIGLVIISIKNKKIFKI